jgi:hypothetical protein
MKPDEIERRFRVADQMVTMYSVLRDRYSAWATGLTLGIMGSSVILCAVTFLPDDALVRVGLSPLGTKIVLGVFSSLILFLSIAELKVDWKQRSSLYGDAAENVAGLKAKYRDLRNSCEPSSPEVIHELAIQYDSVMASLPGVPDLQFVKLKAYHLNKIQLCRMIDSKPGCPLWVLRLKLMWKGFCGKKQD